MMFAASHEVCWGLQQFWNDVLSVLRWLMLIKWKENKLYDSTARFYFYFLFARS